MIMASFVPHGLECREGKCVAFLFYLKAKASMQRTLAARLALLAVPELWPTECQQGQRLKAD